ncbi:MAG: DUF1583 domain-containing protein [Planctomycetota bacterium]
MFCCTTKRLRLLTLSILCILFAFVSLPLPLSAQQSSTPSAKAILLSLRDRDEQTALDQLGALVDRTITLQDLVYSELPSAAGGLHRKFAQLDADERYERLLKWTFPEGIEEADPSKVRIRMLSSVVPTDAPPKVFARSIGERPRDTTFAIAKVGPVSGFFNSGWMLVEAADEAGRLSRFRRSLESLSSSNQPGMQELGLLAQLAGARGQIDDVRVYLEQKISASGQQKEFTVQDLNAAAVASAALLHSSLEPLAETLLSNLVDRSGSGKAIELRAFLRNAYATAVQIHRGVSGPEILFQNRLKYWAPVSVRTARTLSRGQRRSTWLTHEQHLLHLSGSSTDVLYCRFPLTGDFDFVVQTQEGGDIGTDGGLVYGGLHFQALGRKDTLQVWDADQNHLLTTPSPFARHDVRPVFNRVSIRSRGQKSQFESNLHPVYFAAAEALNSPWFGLRSSGAKRPVFRNLKLTGDPIIPREVRLLEGDQLRGWQAGFFDESQPSFHSMDTGIDSVDWSLTSGVLVGSTSTQESNRSKPGLLQYQRPLLENESVQYEFLFEDASSLVHPTIGRLAFLLESGGARVRWITTGDSEWSGLNTDNAALEPLNRRGPRPLPLKAGEWNRVRVDWTDGKLLISLNDELIYQRPVEVSSPSQFGLYRTSRASEVRIRNASLTGDWPETVPESFVKNPLELRNAE